MKIILRKDVEKLGKMGDVVNVKNGYARNFLIPNDIACLAKTGAMRRIEIEKSKQATQLEKIKANAVELANKIANLELSIQMKVGEENKLYGSVTSQIIANKIAEMDYNIDKNNIILEDPIKSLGVYDVKVKLHPEVSTNIKIWVVAEENNAE
ncbi:MAG: 50S ribosomal protein L9 [Bacteroidetes bacterium]|nr:50S ribosomal protein L9 [Bacteroidota bacterium]